MSDTLFREMHHHHGCDVAEDAGKATSHALVGTDLSSSSLSAVDLCGTDIDWGTSAHTSSMDRSYQAIDAVSLESFPWADLSIFQDEEMNAKGIDLDALGTLPLDVDFSKASSGDMVSNATVEKNGKKKGGRRPRGPKPKYVFSSPEQAAAARRERNRAAALQSYYKKKNHTMNLEQQVRELEDEQNKLTMLLEHVENGTITTIHCEGDIEEHISKRY